MPPSGNSATGDHGLTGGVDARPDDLVRRPCRLWRPLLATCGQERAEDGGQDQCASHASAACQRAASRATFAGAVPPKLVREATEASTVRTEKTSAVIR